MAGVKRRLVSTSNAGWSAALRAVAVLVIAGMGLGACGGSSGSPTPAAPPATATSPAVPPTPAPSPSLGDVVWASAIDPETREPVTPVDRFAADAPAIYAVVRVRNVPAGATLSADWSYNDNRLGVAAAPVVVGSAVASGYVEFHLTRDEDQPWPDGTYGIAISLDGQVAATSTVDVINSEDDETS